MTDAADDADIDAFLAPHVPYSTMFGSFRGFELLIRANVTRYLPRTFAACCKSSDLLPIITALMAHNDYLSCGEALISAAFSLNLTVLEFLLGRNFDVNVLAESQNDCDKLPILFRVWEKPTVVRMLLDAGADINCTDADGDTILHYVLRNFNVCGQDIQHLIEYGADASRVDRHGKTPAEYTRDDIRAYLEGVQKNE